MTNSKKNVINPFLESSTLLIMTFPEIVESKDRLWGTTCAVDNVRARRKGVLGKLYEIHISPERGLRNSLKFPSYFGMEYVRPWNMGKKLLEGLKQMHYKNVKSQDALTISPNLAQSSALVETKRYQIATEHLVNMNSTSSHYKQLPYKKLYSSTK